jgi:hypothetical protein
MKGQVNIQLALNPANPSHKKLHDWMISETTNQSAFIRETLFMRMFGTLPSLVQAHVSPIYNEAIIFDRDEVRNILEF